VDATWAAVRHGPTGEALNIGGGEVISAIDALALIERLTGREARVRHAPPRPGEQASALADCARAAEVFGWRPRTGIEAGLRAQVEWMIEEGVGDDAPAEAGA